MALQQSFGFIFLPDCGCCIKIEGMDTWMASDGGGQIQPKCPRCKTTVRTCLRYGDIIKNTYEDIAKVKQKIFNMRGNSQEFFSKASAQFSACVRLLDNMNKLDSQRNSVFEAIWCSLFAENDVNQTFQQKKTGNGRTVDPSIGPDQRFQTSQSRIH